MVWRRVISSSILLCLSFLILSSSIYIVGIADEGGFSQSLINVFNVGHGAVETSYRNLDPRLYDLLIQMEEDELVTVAIWLKANGLAPLERSEVVIKPASVEVGDTENQHPEQSILIASTMKSKNAGSEVQVPRDRNEVIRIDQIEHRKFIDAYQRANADHIRGQVAVLQAPMLAYMNAQGYEPKYVSPIAPLIYVELPKSAIYSMAQREEVLMVYGPNDNYELMNSAKATQKADIVDSWGFEGSGIDVAVVEVGRIQFDNPYLNTGTTRIPADPNTNDHTTGVAGIIASQHTSNQGIAQGVNLYSANATSYEDADLSAAMDWAAGAQNVDIINNSWGGNADTATLNEHDRHLDFIVRYLGSTVTVSAGAETDGCSDQNYRVTSPARAYNVISVGNYTDENSLTWSGDVMDVCSSHVNPSTGVEKPEVAAVGSSISSTNASSPWITNLGSGTSYAAPMVAGEAALLMERDSKLITRPEAVKAIIMTTALNNIEGDSRVSDKDGVGGVDMRAAFHLVDEQWWAWTPVVSGDFPLKHDVYITAGDTVRATIVWDSNPNAGYTTNPLQADLNLAVYDPDGARVTASESSTNNFEIVEFNPSKTGLYEFRITASSFGGSEEFVGFAFWQPQRSLTENKQQTWSTPPVSKHYYRFSPEDFWNVVGVRSPGDGDYDLALFNGSAFSNPAGHVLLEASTSESIVDYIVIDGNHAPSANVYPEVSQLSGNGSYGIEWATSDDLVDADGIYGPYNMTSSQVVRVWNSWLTEGVRIYFALKPISGEADLGMALHDTDPASASSWYQGASQRVVAADSSGAGGDEYMSYETTSSDILGLVVWNNSASSTSSFYLYVDTTAPTGSISINDGAAYTDVTGVSLELQASDIETGVSEMRFSNGSDWTGWETYTTSKTWTLPSGDGSKYVYVQFKNYAGAISSTCEDGIVLDTLPPTGSIQINDGSAATNTTEVNITLSANDAGSGVADMRFKDDFSTWTSWEPFSTNKAWTLLPGEGIKTVYVQYRDHAGRISADYSDDIIFDTTPPSGSILIENGLAYTKNTSVSLELVATDLVAGVADMHFTNDGVNWSAWESYTNTKRWTLNPGEGSKSVYVEYRDSAGNVSSSYSDTIILDTTAPSGSIQINNGDYVSSSRTVELSLSSSDGLSGVADMRFSNTGTSWSTWESYASSRHWTLTSGDGTKTVYVQYRDGAGNNSISYIDTILLDTTGPTGTISINNGAAFTTSTSVILNLSASDSGVGVSKMRFLNQGLSWSNWESYNKQKSWSLTSKDGTKKVYVQFQDNAGNISVTYNDTIVLDTKAPSGSILIESGAKATNTRSIALNLSASDQGTGVDDMRFSNNNSTWSSWEKFTSNKTWNLVSGDGNKTVYVHYRDKVGNISSSYSDEIILDTVAPTSSAFSPATTMRLSFMVSWSGSDGLSGVESYDVQYRVGTGGTWKNWLIGISHTNEIFGPVNPVSTLHGKTYYFRVRAHDFAGNVEPYPSVPDTGTLVVEGVEIFLPVIMR